MTEPHDPHHDPDRPPRRLSVDDAWIVEWADDGQRQIDRLLALHAAFERYVAERVDDDRRIDGG
jgi:hypothetical protein